MKQFQGKQYKEVLSCGVLRTRTGQEYFLLKPDPVVKDSWQYDKQQRFVVVPNTEEFYQGDNIYYSYARHLVTTDPDIEYIYARTPILVQYLNGHDVAEMTWEREELEETAFLAEDEPMYMEHLLDNVDQYNGEGLA